MAPTPSHRTHPLPDRLLRVLGPGLPPRPGPGPTVRGAHQGPARRSPPPPRGGRGLLRRSVARRRRSSGSRPRRRCAASWPPPWRPAPTSRRRSARAIPGGRSPPPREEMPADLVVMGTHGRGGLEHLFLGSVTEKLMRRLPCSVLTVCHEEGRTWEAPGLVRRILCATDFSATSALARRPGPGPRREVPGGGDDPPRHRKRARAGGAPLPSRTRDRAPAPGAGEAGPRAAPRRGARIGPGAWAHPRAPGPAAAPTR